MLGFGLRLGDMKIHTVTHQILFCYDSSCSIDHGSYVLSQWINALLHIDASLDSDWLVYLD